MRSIYKILIVLVILAIIIGGYFMYTSNNIQNNEKNITKVAVKNSNFILPSSYKVHSNISHGVQITNDTNVLQISEYDYGISELLSDYKNKNPDLTEEQLNGTDINVTKTLVSEKNEIVYWFEKNNNSFVILTQKYVDGTDNVVKDIINSIKPIK